MPGDGSPPWSSDFRDVLPTEADVDAFDALHGDALREFFAAKDAFLAAEAAANRGLPPLLWEGDQA